MMPMTERRVLQAIAKARRPVERYLRAANRHRFDPVEEDADVMRGLYASDPEFQVILIRFWQACAGLRALGWTYRVPTWADDLAGGI